MLKGNSFVTSRSYLHEDFTVFINHFTLSHF